jgi:glycosyltransferase involved in cell wall biosynthesis
MKIAKNSPTATLCMVLKGYPRISETFISNEILILESLGYKIHIISMRHPREPFTHDSVKAIRAKVDYLPTRILPNLHILLYHNLLLALERPGPYFKALKKAVARWLRTRRSATVKHLLQAGVLAHKFLPGQGIVHFHAHFAHSPTSVARITEKKGLETVYRALAILRDRGIDCRHTLIGEGDDREKIQVLIKALDLGSRTRLCGTLTHQEVISHYAESDLFVLGCQIAGNGDRDGIPNVMAESMAMNLPVVATNVSGLPEFLEDGVTGRMVPPKDPVKLANAMEVLLMDEALRKRVTRAARKRVERDFDNKKLVRELARTYKAMIPEIG